ncbi:MAG: 16S rRNA (adenine(1518)-N(6)/adenine(1519)-N(6))-dimethyltransferase RsmA [bacterium]
MRAKKSLGQHFLMHASIAARIADAAGIGPKDTVLEIGPGTGLLTRELLSRAGHVVAVETDKELIPILRETFAAEIGLGKLELIHEDIRAFDTAAFPKRYLLVANIPYYISGEILRRFLTDAHQPASMTLLVQKEVAVRIARSKKESLLSLSVKAYGEPKYRFTVPKGAFVPAPAVDSAVLTIENIGRANFKNTAQEESFFSAIRAGFAHKRKLLARNLEAIAAPEAIQHAFLAAEVPEKARAEDLGLSTWLLLASAMHTP